MKGYYLTIGVKEIKFERLHWIQVAQQTRPLVFIESSCLLTELLSDLHQRL